ncbi:hypothetical protein [Bartonella grahamii]|uniref:hypothetical protein n=1 Tax=Bartonella grahamii TaxID=33045 RepID=UPI002E7BFAAF|nr:hypothetical protein [Bartonella grahamii]
MVGVMLVRVLLVRVMYAMALWWHYGCVSGGMMGEVGGVTCMYGNMYVWVNGTLRKHCWRSRGGGWGDVGVMYAMALWWHYGCVSGGMMGEVGGVTCMYGNMYVWVNGTLRKHCWRGRGCVGVMLVRVMLVRQGGLGSCWCG